MWSEVERVPSAAYLLSVAVWQHYRGVAANGNFDVELCAGAVYAYFSVERGRRCLDVLQVADERRGYQQVAKAVRAGLVLYAGERLEQPFRLSSSP